MSKYEVKTLHINASSITDVEFFDEKLERYLNNGYEPIGGVRTIGDSKYYGDHFVTLRKMIKESESACGPCSRKEECCLYKEVVISNNTITSCPYFKPGEADE